MKRTVVIATSLFAFFLAMGLVPQAVFADAETVEKGCLGCHGEPKGERDISGYLREGAKLGELAGTISVKLSQK